MVSVTFRLFRHSRRTREICLQASYLIYAETQFEQHILWVICETTYGARCGKRHHLRKTVEMDPT